MSNPYEIHDRTTVCQECLITENFYIGGGSWSPDCCPKCGNVGDVCFRDLPIHQKKMAEKIHKNMWQKIVIEKMSISDYLKIYKVREKKGIK